MPSSLIDLAWMALPTSSNTRTSSLTAKTKSTADIDDDLFSEADMTWLMTSGASDDVHSHEPLHSSQYGSFRLPTSADGLSRAVPGVPGLDLALPALDIWTLPQLQFPTRIAAAASATASPIQQLSLQGTALSSPQNGRSLTMGQGAGMYPVPWNQTHSFNHLPAQESLPSFALMDMHSSLQTALLALKATAADTPPPSRPPSTASSSAATVCSDTLDIRTSRGSTATHCSSSGACPLSGNSCSGNSCSGCSLQSASSPPQEGLRNSSGNSDGGSSSMRAQLLPSGSAPLDAYLGSLVDSEPGRQLCATWTQQQLCINGCRAISSLLRVVSTVRVLSLTHCCITDNDIMELTPGLLLGPSSVSILDLSHNLIGDHGVRELSLCLSKSSTLEMLQLSHNRIGESQRLPGWSVPAQAFHSHRTRLNHGAADPPPSPPHFKLTGRGMSSPSTAAETSGKRPLIQFGTLCAAAAWVARVSDPCAAATVHRSHAGDSGVAVLASAAKRCPSLSNIHLHGNSQVGALALRMVATSLSSTKRQRRSSALGLVDTLSGVITEGIAKVTGRDGGSDGERAVPTFQRASNDSRVREPETLVELLLRPASSPEVLVTGLVRQIMRHHAAPGTGAPAGLSAQELAERLTSHGVQASVQTALGSASGAGGSCLRNLRHQYVTCRAMSSPDTAAPDDADGGGAERSGGVAARVVVDPTFRDSFEVSVTTPAYKKLLDQIPDVLVAAPLRLPLVVQFLCDRMHEAFAENKLTVPPWREASSILTKYTAASAQA
ncbi:MAG: hypothetical protein WDW38_000443 [Sanguina aurantia]